MITKEDLKEHENVRGYKILFTDGKDTYRMYTSSLEPTCTLQNLRTEELTCNFTMNSRISETFTRIKNEMV